MALAERLTAWREALSGDYVAAAEARRFVDMMRAEHPDELAEWMEANAVRHARIALTRFERSQRASALRDSRRRAFDAGGAEALSLFRLRFAVNDENVRRPLADMTAADLRYAGGWMVGHGERLMDEGGFLLDLGRELADRAGEDSPVREALTEAEVAARCRSWLGSAPLAEVA